MYHDTTVTKRGKTLHLLANSCGSVRHGSKVRQETVAQLGELDAEGRLAARALAERIVGVERQPGLFDDDLPTAPIALDLRGLRLERGRRFGDVWLAWRLWQAVGLDTLLARHCRPGREDRSLGEHGRDPRDRSALFAVERTAHRRRLVSPHQRLDDLVDDDRCYRAARPFAGPQDRDGSIGRNGSACSSISTTIFCSTMLRVRHYFEGWPNAIRSPNEATRVDHRGDCKQVCIGLVVTRRPSRSASRSSPAIATIRRRFAKSSPTMETQRYGRAWHSCGRLDQAWSARRTWRGMRALGQSLCGRHAQHTRSIAGRTH